jgi:type I restriction enzyme S subunit
MYIDISSIDNRSKSITSPMRLLGRDAPSRARQRVKANDVLVATVRPYLNAVAMVPPALDGAVCSTGFTVLRAEATLDPNYLFLFVRSPRFVQELSDLVQGALYPAVTDRDVRDQRLLLPSVAEQRRIAQALNEQLVAIDAMSGAIQVEVDAVEALPAALLKRAFEGGAT